MGRWGWQCLRLAARWAAARNAGTTSRMGSATKVSADCVRKAGVRSRLRALDARSNAHGLDLASISPGLVLRCDAFSWLGGWVKPWTAPGFISISFASRCGPRSGRSFRRLRAVRCGMAHELC